ncbi:hypothetical protein [Elizabethkingia anophelis]|uniref:hypothetical protein n=1 Tax=Elizabethkingia anophelis TaxID=1117645 RepID=UPI0020139941|nr:hypothetical protein [Elizabethkingia anophelis]EJC8061055.1 hypothetical protein [Elizabethkingia anophelis]MCL1641000.1 hypothetical protein [Elizabethkingia anophelis]MCL1646800.1 hypothetical protein [Elizabethkingia anophelis]MCT3927805.1 hypothetical protein [Elizabethkingia anophelis]MCT4102363.1 hypothetical protein [Elizabethkingia anophelis]
MLERFKDDILKDVNSQLITQKYLIDGESYFFREFFPLEEFEFKKGLADILNIHIRDISIVGSGKLGFSLKPNAVEPSLYEFKEFDFDYNSDHNNDKSDIDVAIISEKLFEYFLKDIYLKTNKYRTIPEGWGQNRKSFSYYALKGWFRKDFLYDGYDYEKNIIEFIDLYKKKFKRDINLGIYKSWFYFEHYHISNIDNIKINLLYNV